MKKINTLLLLVLALAISLIALFVVLQYLADTGAGERNFRIDADREVVKVTLGDRHGNSVRLEKTADAHWILNDEGLANMRAVRDMLSTLRQMDVRRPVSLQRRDSILEDMQNDGVVVDVYAKSHLLRLPGNVRLWTVRRRISSFLAGSDTPDGKATYMQMKGASLPFEVYLPGIESGISNVFSTEEHLWRDPFVRLRESGELTEVSARFNDDKEQSWRLTADGNAAYQLFDHKDQVIHDSLVNHGRISGYPERLTYLYFERLIPSSAEHPPGDLVTDQPFLELWVYDDHDNETVLRFFYRYAPDDGTLTSDHHGYDPNRFYLRVNDGDYAIAQYHVFHPVIRTFSWFVAE